MITHIETHDATTVASSIQPLHHLYIIRNPGAVARFLENHSAILSSTLIEARRKIESHFGSQSPVILEVMRDPELHDFATLFVYVKTSLSPDEACKRLRQFDREWFLKQSHAVLELLNFDVEYE